MRRRFLVMARAGDNSLHRHWLSGGPRNFDLFLSCYGKDPSRHEGTAEHIRPMGSTKWPALHDHLRDEAGLVAAYDAVWFPDDDVLIDAPAISRMFELFTAFGLSLAQPSLTHDSHFSHSAVLRDPAYVVRFANFVEVMAPVFSPAALGILHPTFAQSRIGWGLDLLWPQLLARQGDHRMGLIDATPMTHTRPVGGGDIYAGRDGVREADIASLAVLYPGVDLDMTRQRARFCIEGGVRLVGPRSPWLARLMGRAHRFWAKRLARATTRHPGVRSADAPPPEKPL